MQKIINFLRSYYFAFLLLISFFLSACASSPTIAPQINSLIIAEKFDYALNLLEKTPEAYGPQNHLLYLLDYGLTLHLAKRYQDSIKVFEESKKLYDELYTVSLTNQAKTWVINDNVSPYRPEDFERAMINVFQALNFASLNNIEEALVEARDVDQKLKLFNQQYGTSQKNLYTEDGLIRLLMGIFYESSGSSEDLRDALISYKQAVETYENHYQLRYDLEVPEILKENLLSLSQKIDSADYQIFERKFTDTEFLSWDERKQMAEIIIVNYRGLSPIKHQIDIPIPLPNGLLAKLSFPTYDQRIFDSGDLAAQLISNDQRMQEADFQTVEDVGAIAIENLNNRKFRVIAKAAIRSGLKVFVESNIEEMLKEKYSNDSARYFSYISSLYNLASEQADLRSWQTLPNTIEVARFFVEPGIYQVQVGEMTSEVEAKAGQKHFMTFRSNRQCSQSCSVWQN